jgi:hypothetical protein
LGDLEAADAVELKVGLLSRQGDVSLCPLKRIFIFRGDLTIATRLNMGY